MTPRYPFHIDPPHKGTASELEIQASFRRKVREIDPNVLVVAIPNEGKRSTWEAIKRKREGMMPGFPDVMILHDRRAFFAEFKTGKGVISGNQIDTLNALVRRNFVVGVFRSADTALDWLRGHGVLSWQ